MQLRACLVIGVVCVGCGNKEQHPAAGSSSGSASGSATASGAASGSAVAGSGSVSSAASTDAGVAPDASTASVASGCLPENPATFARIGADLVACVNDDTQCWALDAKTGAVAPRAPGHLPGVGFTVNVAKLPKPGCYEDMCWTVPTRESDADVSVIWVAYHPDGKRVAILDDPAGTIFDLSTKKPIAKFSADLGNSLGGLWFAGNFVADAGFDAGPYAVIVYHDAKTGKKVGTFEDFFGGSANVTSTGSLVVVGQDMTSVSVIDGASWKGKTTKRKIPKPPTGCSPQDPGLDTESDDPKVRACVAFATKHYAPYGGAMLVDDPTGAAAFVGLANDQLFTVDKNLVETSRVKLSMCPPKPDQE